MHRSSLALVVLALMSCDRHAARRSPAPPVAPRIATSPSSTRVVADLDGDGASDALVALGALGVQVLRGRPGGLSPGASIGASVEDPSRIAATAIAVGRHRAHSVAFIGERMASLPLDSWRCARGRIRVLVFESGQTRELASLDPPVGYAQLGRAIDPVGDLDHDGYDDFLVLGARAEQGHRWVRTPQGTAVERAHEECGEPALFLLRGGAAPTLSLIDVARASPHALIARFDHANARADLVTFQRQLLFYRGTASGFAREPTPLDAERTGDVGTAVAIASGDVDGDGLRDVVVAFSAAAGEIARVYFGPLGAVADSGALARTVSLSAPSSDGGATAAPARGLIVADFDGDRVDDVLVGDPGASRLLLYRGGASMTPSSEPSILRGPEAEQAQFGAYLARLGDLDGDQSPEVLAPVQIRTAEATLGNAWLVSPRNPSDRGRAVAPPTARESFAHAVASATSATQGVALSVPPLPRRCAVADASSLVMISVEANVVASGVVTRATRSLIAPPPSAIATIDARIAPARAAVARCHARWLQSDCNHTAVLTLPFATLPDGALSSEGANSVAGIDAEPMLDCVRDAIAPGRIAAPPRGRAYGIVVSVRLAPAP